MTLPIQVRVCLRRKESLSQLCRQCRAGFMTKLGCCHRPVDLAVQGLSPKLTIYTLNQFNLICVMWKVWKWTKKRPGLAHLKKIYDKVEEAKWHRIKAACNWKIKFTISALFARNTKKQKKIPTFCQIFNKSFCP